MITYLTKLKNKLSVVEKMLINCFETIMQFMLPKSLKLANPHDLLPFHAN